MKRLIAVIVATVSALLVAGGSGAANPPGISPLNTVVDYGELVRVSGTPEVCGLTRAPTRIKIQNKIWTKPEMSPVIFCWASKSGKPIIGNRVAMIYWIRGKTIVGLTTWKKGGKSHPYPVFLYPDMIWPIQTAKLDWGAEYSMDLQIVPLSTDQLAGKIKKRTQGYMGRGIIPREARQFECNAQPGPPVAVICGRTGTWDEWSQEFWVTAPWSAQDVMVTYRNPSCGCQWSVAYDPSGLSSSGGG